jgi:hypothetical protein
MTKPANILYEGPCAYAVPNGNGTCDIVVYSSNSVTHITVSKNTPSDRAEIITRRFNGYPLQTRGAYGLL